MFLTKEKKCMLRLLYTIQARIYSKDESSVWETMREEKEIWASSATASQTAKVMATLHGTCLVKMEKVLHLLVKDMNREHILTEGNMLSQKVLSLYKEFSKGFQWNEWHQSFTARDGYTDPAVGLKWKVKKLLYRLHLSIKKLLPYFQQSWRSSLRRNIII